MAIGNIASKCQRKKKVSSDEKLIGEMNLEEKLDVIQEYICDQIDIHDMASELSRTARSNEGSSRRRGRVHFSE